MPKPTSDLLFCHICGQHRVAIDIKTPPGFIYNYPEVDQIIPAYITRRHDNLVDTVVMITHCLTCDYGVSTRFDNEAFLTLSTEDIDHFATDAREIMYGCYPLEKTYHAEPT